MAPIFSNQTHQGGEEMAVVYSDDTECRREPLENPFGPKVLPMSPEQSVTGAPKGNAWKHYSAEELARRSRFYYGLPGDENEPCPLGCLDHMRCCHS